MPIKKATEEDYIKLQGGMPEVYQDEKGLWHVYHKYDEDDPINIVSHKNPLEGQEINIGGKLYSASLLRRFHGDPCEKNSRKLRGYGYSRGEGEERSRA